MTAGKMPQLVDTHCHIQSAGLKEGERATRELWAKAPELTAEGIAAAADQAGVSKLICVGCDPADSRLAVDFVRRRAGCWASVGIHPHEARHFAGQTGELKKFAALAAEDKVVAVGECGFDFYYNHSPKEDQIQVLKFQIELALEHNLPMIFHVREAFDDFWPVFDAYPGVKGVVHSFTDSLRNLEKTLERGLYVGVNGIATFAKNPAQLEVYKSVPLGRMVLETDAPFLTPTPYRGKINEPKRLTAVADFLAELRSEDRAELSEATTRNARELFKI
jgi:TatD DNase family protein